MKRVTKVKHEIFRCDEIKWMSQWVKAINDALILMQILRIKRSRKNGKLNEMKLFCHGILVDDVSAFSPVVWNNWHSRTSVKRKRLQEYKQRRPTSGNFILLIWCNFNDNNINGIKVFLGNFCVELFMQWLASAPCHFAIIWIILHVDFSHFRRCFSCVNWDERRTFASSLWAPGFTWSWIKT